MFRVSIFLTILATSSATHADTGGFVGAVDRQRLQVFAGDGIAALVESGWSDLHSVHLTTRVRASASRVAALITDPKNVKNINPAVDDVQKHPQLNRSTAYDWWWRLGTFTWRGRNIITDYTAAPNRVFVRPYRIEVKQVQGDLGTGRFIWRIDPVSSSECWVHLFARLDLRTGNYLAQGLSSASRSFNRSTTLAMAFFMMVSVRNISERAKRPSLAGLPHFDHQLAYPLLERGDLAWVDISTSRIQNALVMGRMGVSRARVDRIMASSRDFGEAMLFSSLAQANASSSDGSLMRWSLNIPLLGSSGTMKLIPQKQAMLVSAVEGAMKGGQWRFESLVGPAGDGVVVGSATFDPGDGFWLTRQLVEHEPRWSPGLAVASQIMGLRAIRSYVSSH